MKQLFANGKSGGLFSRGLRRQLPELLFRSTFSYEARVFLTQGSLDLSYRSRPHA